MGRFGVMALVLEPWYNWLRHRARLPDVAAIIVVFASILVPLAVVLPAMRVMFDPEGEAAAVASLSEMPFWKMFRFLISG